MASTVPPKVLFKKLERAFRECLPEDCDHLLDECALSLSSYTAFITHCTIGVKLCQNYDLTPDQLFWKWETVKHLSREARRLDVSNMDELKKYIAQEQAKSSRSTNKGSSARLSGVMSVRGGASGYGPGRTPRQPNTGFASGVKREAVDHPVAGSSRISFLQVDKVERRECKC